LFQSIAALPATMKAAVFALALLEGANAFQMGGLQPVAPAMPRVSDLAMAEYADRWSMGEITPDGSLAQRVEGKSRKTWKFNDLSKDRVQCAVNSDGRPVNADIQLWIGPDWTPFKLRAYTEDGKARPINTLIGTRNKVSTIEVRNVGPYEYPLKAASNYAKDLMATAPLETPPNTAIERVDGGALRSFPLDPETEQIELVLKTDGRQLNARVELLNGPNNPKQTFEVFTNNGELNCLCVAMNNPDAGGSTVRIQNLGTLEFPCYIHLKEN